MKGIIITGLFVLLSFCSFTVFGQESGEAPVIEVVFALDTIDSILSEVAQAISLRIIHN